MRMKTKKKIAAAAAAVTAFITLGTNVFSIIDVGVGESGLVNNDNTPYKVNIVSGGKTVAVVPIGVGLRGDSNSDKAVTIYDAIEIAEYLVGKADKDYEGSFGHAMADGNLDGEVNIYDAINIAAYILTEGTHEEKWAKVLGKQG